MTPPSGAELIAKEPDDLVERLRKWARLLDNSSFVGPPRLVGEAIEQLTQLRSTVLSLINEIDFVISGGDNERETCAECGLAGIGMLRDARRKAVELPIIAAELDRLQRAGKDSK